MRTLAALLVPLLCIAAGAPDEIAALIDRARGAPGEFAADVMIRIAGLDRVDKARKMQLLEEAFLRASEAQQPYKRHPAISRLDAPAGFQNRAFNQDLDGLSLRLRAVERMLPLDSRKARELFEQIPPPRLPQLACQDFLVYDVSRFFAVAGRVASQSFTAREIERGEPFQFLARYAGAIASPVEVAPAAAMIAAAGLKDDDFQLLVATFAHALGRIEGDDRSFTFSLPAAGSLILELVEEGRRRQAPPLALIERYRLYLVNHLSAARCADDNDMQPSGISAFSLGSSQLAELAGSDGVAFFNEKIRAAPLAPIEAPEAAPAKVEGTVADLEACKDPECQEIQKQYRELGAGPDRAYAQSANRATDEWQEKLRQFLVAMAGWKESTGATPAQHFRDKAGILNMVCNLAPPGRGRDMVVEAILDYLRQSRLAVENREEWFLPAHVLIAFTGIDPQGSRSLADKLRAAADPVIALYASLEALAPHTMESVAPIL
ncbi:MAG: hypothetical protein LAP87_21385 [Acidobacteriia bacterium]|nr:hypothetical protein [Terriglobia bacterium]